MHYKMTNNMHNNTNEIIIGLIIIIPIRRQNGGVDLKRIEDISQFWGRDIKSLKVCICIEIHRVSHFIRIKL